MVSWNCNNTTRAASSVWQVFWDIESSLGNNDACVIMQWGVHIFRVYFSELQMETVFMYSKSLRCMFPVIVV